MIKKILLPILFFSFLFSQVSLRDIEAMTNEQLDTIKAELLKQNESQEDNVNYTPSIEEVIINQSDKSINDSEKSSSLFGYDYFKRDLAFFDNLPTPANYLLGPGDEVVLSLWGETNMQQIFTLSKEGLIFFEDVGFINLTNKSLKDAELLLIKELSKIYSTLSGVSKSTELMLELGTLKSINVFFTGHIENPGINLIHPFSDIFSAIVQAGGIKESGSLRNVKLIRDNLIIEEIDFYSFFVSGKNSFSSTKLIDGDIIHIPVAKNKVEINGEIISPGIYELRDEETIESLISYAGGFTPLASSNIILDTIIPLEERKSDDYAQSSINIDFKLDNQFKLNNGDKIDVIGIGEVSSKVQIYGRVKSPGEYSAKNMTLKKLLDIAGGFDDPVFSKTISDDKIVVLRKDKSQLYAQELIFSYDNSDQVELKVDDKIFVYEDIRYNKSLIYSIEGEVLKPGTYSYVKGLTIQDALNSAGGINELSSEKNIIVSQSFTKSNDAGQAEEVSEVVSNVNLDFEIGPNSVIKVLPYENVVRVEGNIYNPGLVVFSKGLTLGEAISLSGGYKPYTMKNRVYIKSTNGEVSKPGLIFGSLKRLRAGDSIFIPVDPNPSDFDITSFVADFSSTLANIAAILVIARDI